MRETFEEKGLKSSNNIWSLILQNSNRKIKGAKSRENLRTSIDNN